MLQNVPVTKSASKADSVGIKSRTRAELLSPDLNMSNTTRFGVFKIILRGQIIASSSLASSPSYCWFPDHNAILEGRGGEGRLFNKVF
jgi:hypothetical protein